MLRWLVRGFLALVALVIVVAAGLGGLYYSYRVQIPDLAQSRHVASAVSKSSDPDTIKNASARLEELRRSIGYPGVSIAVARGEALEWIESRGWASLEAGTPVTEKTRFAIGSISKTLTAAVALRLAERGTLNLDADIRTYLPEFPAQSQPITMRQLLSHQAGIRHYRFELSPPTFSDFGSATQYNSVIDSLQAFASDPVLFQPDTGFAYSTYGYTLASAVMERAARQEFLALTDSELFSPLRLLATGADDKRAVQPERASDYQNLFRDGAVLPAPFTNSSGKWAGGGFRSTPSDLARFGGALLGGKIVSANMLEVMATPRKLSNGTVNPQNYGLGVRIDTVTSDTVPGKSFKVIHHGGVAVGSQAMLVMMPEHGLTVALCVNATTQPPARDLFDAATDIGEIFSAYRP